MRNLFILVMLLIGGKNASAQFTLSAYGTALYNTSGFFKDFRDYYNTVNASSMSKNLGSPNLSAGYTFELGYRIMGLTSSVSRSMLSGRTHATFTNDARRILKYDYKITTVNIGFYKEIGKSEISAEIGMVHLMSDLYSYAKLPNDEEDNFAGGTSHASNWANIGGNAKLNYMYGFNKKLYLNLMLQGIYVNNQKDVAPRLVLDGHQATHTLIGGGVSLGLTYKVGKKL